MLANILWILRRFYYSLFISYIIISVIALLLCCFQDVDLDKESLRRQLEEMQRQAEAYKLQLQQKEQEAAAYKKKLDESIVTSEEA